jgi:hypothetical protein
MQSGKGAKQMITDILLRTSNAQVVTATALSTNVIDLSQARDIGEGKKLVMAISIQTAPAAVGAATVEFQIIGSPNADLSAGTVIGSSGAIGKADARLGVGRMVYVDFNSLYMSTGYRYVGVNYNVATGPLTAGTFTADVVETVQDFKTYPGGFTVV